MKYIILDWDEFDSGESFTGIACSHVKRFASFKEFYEATTKGHLPSLEGVELNELSKKYLAQIQYSDGLITSIKEHCGVTLASNDEIIVVSDSWDIQDYVFQNKHTYYRYIWETTA